jgi:hypothetical protein
MQPDCRPLRRAVEADGTPAAHVAASFSQGSVLSVSVSAIARDLGLPRKTVEGYSALHEDPLIAVRLPVFTRRARRALIAHPKFYYFDAGVYRALQPRGPLDARRTSTGPPSRRS